MVCLLLTAQVRVGKYMCLCCTTLALAGTERSVELLILGTADLRVVAVHWMHRQLLSLTTTDA